MHADITYDWGHMKDVSNKVYLKGSDGLEKCFSRFEDDPALDDDMTMYVDSQSW